VQYCCCAILLLCNTAAVQALMAAVNIPRQQAVDALKAAKGDPSVALAQQLQRLKLNHKLLDVLMWEYACDRWAGHPPPPLTVTGGRAPPPGSLFLR
jgi:hypothetical protein